MDTLRIDRQYSTGLSRHNIEQALNAAGKDLKHLQPADLGTLDDFHTLGRIATSQLAELPKSAVTTKFSTPVAGSAGLPGSSPTGTVAASPPSTSPRSTAKQPVGSIDSSAWTTGSPYTKGDVTDLPFAQTSFTVVMSQHIQVNVLDKTRLYQQARRVLVTGGRLAIWDITADRTGKLDYPLP